MAQHFDQHRRAAAEGREFLETLLFLRGLYAERGPRDRAPIASSETIVADTGRRMRAPRFEVSV